MSRRRQLHPEPELLESDENEPSLDLQEVEEKTPKVENSKNLMTWLGVAWHFLMVVFYSLLLYHGGKLMNGRVLIPDPKGLIPAMGGRLKFLTHINEWIQLVFFSVQFLTDIISNAQLKKRLQKASDFIFTTLALPTAAIIVTTFWGIYAIDRNLIYPEILDRIIPPYMNHFWHTTIILWVLCEIYFVHHHFPTTATVAASLFMFGGLYIAWIVYIFIHTGRWAYPFMILFPHYGIVLFFGSSLLLTLGLHMVGKWVSYIRWGKITYMD